RAKAPGAPVLPSGNVVLDVGPKQGQPGPASIGCSLLTVIGATQRASAGCAERAAAFACTLVESIEKSLAKKPGAVRVTLTITVSLVARSVRNVMPPRASMPPPLLPAYVWAENFAAVVSTAGRWRAAARAPASAVPRPWP